MSNELTFNGKSFSDFSAYIATSNFLDGAAKDVQSVSIAGRSGALQLSNGKYNNLTLNVRMYITQNMQQNMREMRSFLESCWGYCRYEETQTPNEFRMASFKAAFVPDVYDVNAGVVELTFDAMPQRFLKSGETSVPVSSVTETTSGNPVYIRNMASLVTIDDLQFAVEPLQEGSGNPSATNIRPFVGRTQATVYASQKNLLQNTSSSSTDHGITYTKQSDGTVVANGTADEDASFIINFTWNLDDGDYQLSGCAEGGSSDTYYCFLWDRSTGARAKDWNGNASGSSYDPTQIVPVRLEKGVNYGFYLRVKAGVTVSNITFYPMLCQKGHSTAFVRYNPRTATINFGKTVYGGYVDITSGAIHAYPFYASYNNETLTGAWLSDRDVYVAGRKPTVGAQVLNVGGERVKTNVGGQTVTLPIGVCYVWSDTGRVNSIRLTSPASLTNPTLFESKPIIRVWGNGTLNVNSYYITVADSPFDYIDIDCELMDCYHGSSNANQYVTFSTTGFVTLKSGANYFSYSGFSGVRVIPRWYEI